MNKADGKGWRRCDDLKEAEVIYKGEGIAGNLYREAALNGRCHKSHNHCVTYSANHISCFSHSTEHRPGPARRYAREGIFNKLFKREQHIAIQIGLCLIRARSIACT